MEPDEGLEKLEDALKVCCLYRDTFFAKKHSLNPYFKEKPVVEWDFKPSLIFSRVDRFIDQLKMIKVSFLAAQLQLNQKVNLLCILFYRSSSTPW